MTQESQLEPARLRFQSQPGTVNNLKGELALISKVDLKSQTVKELGKRARDLGISGYASMRKDELVKALSNKLASRKSCKNTCQEKESVSATVSSKSKRTTHRKRKTSTRK